VSKHSPDSSVDDEVVVEIAGGGVVESGQSPGQAGKPVDSAPLARFKRRLERYRGLAEEEAFISSFDDEEGLKLQVMLLREENARLKAGHQKPSDLGSLIESVRTLSDPADPNELVDESWGVLAECAVLREGLDQACIEIQAALNSVRERLATLGTRIEDIAKDGARTSHAANTSLPG
jgi:hypothetical protein